MGLPNNLGKLSNMITSTGSAVGIAQTSPSFTLDVTGTGRFTGALTGTSATFSGDLTLNNGSADGGQLVLASSGFSNWNLDNFSGRFRAYYGATEYFTIASTGSVGIGTTPPTTTNFSHLFVGKNISMFSGSSTDIYIGSNFYYDGGFKVRYSEASAMINTNAGDFIFQNSSSGTAGGTFNGIERMRITSSGNVGIGTSDATHRLTMQNGTSEVGIRMTDGTNNTYFALCAANNNFANGTIAGDTVVRATNGVCLAPNNGSAVAMRIASGGQVLIGTTSTTNIGGDKLFVYGNNNVFTSQTTGGQGRWTMIGWNSADSGDNSLIEFGVNSTYSAKGSVDYARGSNVIRYNTTSDANLKTIIGDSDLQKSIQILKSTRIREYSWKDDKTNKPQIGVIAQELYVTFTGAVSKGSDNELFGTEEYKNWSVDKTAFTFHLIAGWQMHEKLIKEQQEIINQLSAKVTALESKS